MLGTSNQDAQAISQYANQRYFQKGLLGYKMDYDRAAAMGDEAGMQAAHQGALALQDLARENNVDITGFGSDANLQQAQERYNYNNFRHLNEMNEDVDSGTFYRRQFEKYKQAGMSDKGADYYASQEAEQYQRNYIRKMKDELWANGFTNGAFNPYGERLIDMIHDESPEALTAIATRLPGYLQEYAYQIGQRARNDEYNRRLGIMNTQQNFQRDIQNDKNNLTWRMANMENDTKRYAIDKTAEQASNKQSNKGEQLNSKQVEWANKHTKAMAELEEVISDPRKTPEEKWAAEGKYNDFWDELLNSGAFAYDDPLLNRFREYAEQAHQKILSYDRAASGKVPINWDGEQPEHGSD